MSYSGDCSTTRALCWLRLRGCGPSPAAGQALPAAAAAPATPTPSHWRLTVGELESVVQARPADKAAKPGKWREHSYELSLVTPQVTADDHASEPRPESAPPPVVLDAGSARDDGVSRAVWQARPAPNLDASPPARTLRRLGS